MHPLIALSNVSVSKSMSFSKLYVVSISAFVKHVFKSLKAS
jgi:hypothetical protein